MDTVIEFENVSFSYPSHQSEAVIAPALCEVNLKIGKGELVAVLGHNGSGKSTLAKMVNGLCLPGSGKVFVRGMNTADEDKILKIRQTAGLVFQNPDNQIVATVVEEDVAFALENLGVPSGEIRLRVDEALHTVGMYEYREHSPHRLSGGQKQRVAIAGILAMNPEILILDEPTAMLDPQGREEVIETVLGLCRDRGVTVIMVTHHMSEAALCRRVLVMDKGRICLDDAPENIFLQYDRLKELGLSSPQTVELAREIGIYNVAPLTAEACAVEIYKRMIKPGDS
ncbi:MAG: energy-coupling factor transporter ATPase [Oscillospiraceae bacterium]|nr:energy-coupling factor transporter ATPase [Oscillospiraceae bacterium]